MKKRHLHYADDSNDVSLKSFIVAADAIIKNYITDNFGSEYPSAIKQASFIINRILGTAQKRWGRGVCEW
jgi:hypothetical protein